MKTSHIVLLVIGLIVVGVVGSFFSYYNQGVRAEAGIKAAYENNENILGQYSLKVKEAAKVSDKYSEALTQFVTDSMTGRYGEDGSQAQMQWIQENIPDFDASMYKKIQQIIEAGRTKFENAQTELVDRKRAYFDVELKSPWSGLMLSLGGFPKINEDDYKIITSGHAKKTFETGVDEGVDF
ncbi:MAG: hypothetical protein CMP47_12435 [Rickettsiales bacterium]|nr:hypothetical protein [Rickettsiales bacterium]